MDISSETSTPRAPVPRLCPGLMSLQCGLPLEDWDDQPRCASCRALDDPPCWGLSACPVCAQWPEDKRQRFLATQSITAGQRGTSFLSPPPDQSLPSFSSLLSVDLGPPPAPCPPTPPPSTGSTGLLPLLQDTLSSVLARLDSLESAQHSGGEKDSTLPPTAPAPARGLAGPARHRSRSPMLVSIAVFLRGPSAHQPLHLLPLPGASTPHFTVSIVPASGWSSKATPTSRRVCLHRNGEFPHRRPLAGFLPLLRSPSARRRNRRYCTCWTTPH